MATHPKPQRLVSVEALSHMKCIYIDIYIYDDDDDDDDEFNRNVPTASPTAPLQAPRAGTGWAGGLWASKSSPTT
jgi:hypothetical protein